jgi:hypothetical protein
VVEGVADPDGLRPRSRHEDAEHVPADGGEDPEVEEVAPDVEQTPFEELRGAGGPSVLIAAVAPDMADDEGGEADVRNDDPEEKVDAAHEIAPTA